MKKTGKMGLCLLIGTALLTSIGLYAQEKESTSVSESKTFYHLEGIQWVEQCIEQYPEIRWLADNNVRKTEEGQASLKGSYSEQLFGQKYVEFDRTIMTIYCLKLILDGSDQAYQTFVASQSKDARLSRESFNTLHLQGQKLLKSQWQGMSELEMAQAMETALVLGDIGKSEKAREIFKPFGIQSPDHDDFYGEAMQVIAKHPELCPSFPKLPPSAKQLLAEIANLAHYGHVTHLEGGLNMLTKLKESGIASKDPIALSFDLFIHTCDVAGALGHVNNQSSLVYTESTHQAMQAMADAVRVLSNPHKNELDAYNFYLNTRASWLGLDPNDSSDRVLARMGAMLRLYTLEEGAILRKGIEELDPSIRRLVNSQLDVHSEDLSCRTATYMPTVLINLSNNPNLGKTKEERLSKAISIGLPFIARALKRYKELLLKNEIDANVPLNFNKIAGYAKTLPSSLNGEFFIDNNGNVLLNSE